MMREWPYTARDRLQMVGVLFKYSHRHLIGLNWYIPLRSITFSNSGCRELDHCVICPRGALSYLKSVSTYQQYLRQGRLDQSLEYLSCWDALFTNYQMSKPNEAMEWTSSIVPFAPLGCIYGQQNYSVHVVVNFYLILVVLSLNRSYLKHIYNGGKHIQQSVTFVLISIQRNIWIYLYKKMNIRMKNWYQQMFE